MKRILAIAILLIVAATALHAKTYVITVGISDYYGTQNDLKFAADDSKKVAQFFKKLGCDVTLITSKKATHDNIITAIRRVGKKATPKDRIIFQYSGHGGKGFINTYNDPKLKNQVMTFEELVLEMAKINGGQKLLIIDSCHSGSMANVVMSDKNGWQEKARNSNMAFLMSADVNETAAEYYNVGGFLTRSFLNCLHGMGDTNGDHKITYKEMYDYVSDAVQKRTNGRQNPQFVYGPGMLNAVLTKW